MLQPLIIVLSIIIILVIHRIITANEYLTVEASDGIDYQILDDYDNMKQTAELLAEVNKGALELIAHLRRRYISGEVNERTALLIRRLTANYDFEKVHETQPTGQNGTSYTVEKGVELHLCTRRIDTHQLHTKHELMFVMIHELAHMANPTWGHEKDFWEVFKYLLEEARIANIHQPVDYKKNPLVYCGLLVNYNPWFDPTCEQIW